MYHLTQNKFKILLEKLLESGINWFKIICHSAGPLLWWSRQWQQQKQQQEHLDKIMGKMFLCSYRPLPLRPIFEFLTYGFLFTPE